jgi:hypothetical protein
MASALYSPMDGAAPRVAIAAESSVRARPDRDAGLLGASGGAPVATPVSADGPGAPSPSNPEEDDPITAGQRALRDGRIDEAIRWFRLSSGLPGDGSRGMMGRYLLAQALHQRGDSPAEALAAFQAFLTRDRARAPARLVAVAEAAVARLTSTSADWAAWEQLSALQRTLPRRTYAERRVSIESFLEGSPPAPVARAARLLLLQEAWAAADWRDAITTLEALGAGSSRAEPLLRAQLLQARKERQRLRLAWGAGVVLALALVGLLALRPWRDLRLERRRVIAIVINWTALAWMLYGVYQLGRRSSDVSPVTLDRFLVLWSSITLALVLGIGWILALRGRLSPEIQALASLLVAVTVCGSAVYLFCFAYDYIPVLGL